MSKYISKNARINNTLNHLSMYCEYPIELGYDLRKLTSKQLDKVISDLWDKFYQAVMDDAQLPEITTVFTSQELDKLVESVHRESYKWRSNY